MNLEDYLFNSLTQKHHKSYMQARIKQGMSYIANYDDWLAKHHELTDLSIKNQQDTWENSEYNPANYPDFDSLDDDTKQQRIMQGNTEYWRHSEALEAKIRDLEHLLINPDELEADLDNDSEPAEYWTIDD